MTDSSNILAMLSAYLDGELSAADEAKVLDAMSQDEELLSAFEAMSAVRTSHLEDLSQDEAEALTASVMAETDPDKLPATLHGSLFATQLTMDAETETSPDLERFSADVLGFVATSEAIQTATRAVASVPHVARSLAQLPALVDARVNAQERIEILAFAACDDAATPAENAELLLCDPDDLLHVTHLHVAQSHVGEALRVAASSPAFSRFAVRAGAAALQVIDAMAAQNPAQNVAPVIPATRAEPSTRSWWSRFVESAPKAPLAFAAAAAAVFFLVRPTGVPTDVAVEAHSTVNEELVSLLSSAIFAEPSVPALGDLPLIDDNAADIQAIEGTNTTVVFSTESSNITVIWLAADVSGNEDGEQGT